MPKEETRELTHLEFFEMCGDKLYEVLRGKITPTDFRDYINTLLMTRVPVVKGLVHGSFEEE